MELRAQEAGPDNFPDLLRLTYPGAKTDSALEVQVKAEWEWLWRSGRFLATVVTDGDRDLVVGLLGAVLIAPAFYRRLTVASQPYVNRRLARESEPGDRPFPSEKGLVDGTATLLFNYFAWDASLPELDAAVVRGHSANAFLDQHGGYALARIALELIGTEYLEMSRKTGSKIVNDYSAWVRERDLGARDRPFLVSIDRAEALQTENHWYTRAFRYQTPKLGLSSVQRETLRLAREGLTDAQIADRLSVGVESIRKRWDGVYARFYERAPGTLAVAADGKRGMEKRRLVLNYLRDRLEELRP